MKLITQVDITPAADDAWHLYTVPSELTGFEAAIVMITSSTTSTAIDDTFVRPTGTVHPNVGTQGESTTGVHYVSLDGSNQIEVFRSSADTTAKIVLLGGVSSSEATVFSTAYNTNDIKPVANDTWENIDISSYLGGDTAIAAIVQFDCLGGSNFFGYGYEAADTPTRIFSTYGTKQIVVPVTSGSVRLNTNSTTNAYLVGYFTGGLRLNTTRSALADTNNVWTAVTATDVQVGEDIALVHLGDDFSTTSHARTIGATLPDAMAAVNGTGHQMPVLLDGSDQFELYTNYTGSSKIDWFATNDVAPSGPTTDSVDIDNDVILGQQNVVIATSNIPASLDSWTAKMGTQGGTSIDLTPVSRAGDNFTVHIPTDISPLSHGQTYDVWIDYTESPS